ncbi:hypothetical protein NEUTE1DRAFT_128056 [Neurospora tetrasperma FGSC 2508]|uniref:Uncharacterized protein n=1 Tax=Neurospora tetrasperma (strain FGSC 2508 / ATCC MYA-4615 / P0657) TaxID=510951 RepID=F8MDH3_NEUT8|nr:uncharacterized protein NEUTE1DRAFT_128056 [Neurospora tetrasperma FGSC 2508]EGO61464.1 hypothetical protein NEUTE1DRAFT_128056 [Neurospora tetrasperma FGSC 2508]EGZ74502.1 hypothetical protein NEUTE2DRAFT_155188 [Neurospora tetrasperma FGSC 2509]
MYPERQIRTIPKPCKKEPLTGSTFPRRSRHREPPTVQEALKELLKTANDLIENKDPNRVKFLRRDILDFVNNTHLAKKSEGIASSAAAQGQTLRDEISGGAYGTAGDVEAEGETQCGGVSMRDEEQARKEASQIDASNCGDRFDWGSGGPPGPTC